MAKPIISIDVDDSKFQKFLELFSSYQDKLEEQPDLWESISKTMGGASDALKEGARSGADALAIAAAQADLIGSHLRDAVKAQNDFTRTGKAGWQSFSRSGQSAARGVSKAFAGAVGGSIAEMGAGIAGVAETAAAALGPVGLAAAAIAAVVGGTGAALKGLADVAVTRQRAAYSLGITPGQQAGFDVYGQQFMGAGALQAAANAQVSLSSTGPLQLLGIDFAQARKMSVSDLAFKMLGGAVKAAKANPELPLENVPGIQAYLALGGQVGDVRNALKLGPAALTAAAAESARNAARLDLNSNAVAKAARLKKSVEAAGITVQSGAINNLSGADGGIATVLGALTGDKSAQAQLGNAFHQTVTTIKQHVDPALDTLKTKATQTAAALGSIVHSLTSPIAARAAAADALGSIEGTYSSVNSDSGALGRWQFMPSTADEHLGAAWIKKFGSTSTARGRAAFLGSPKAQQAAFDDFYDQLHRDASKRTKDPKQIMRMIALGWYGGEGSWDETQAQLNAPQRYGGHDYPSQNEYADKFERLVAGKIATTDPKTGVAIAHAVVRATRTAKPHVSVYVSNNTASNVATSVNAGAQM